MKWGEVFRSGRLPSLSDADVDRLESLGIRTVVNFLTPAEIEHAGADRLPEGVREIPAPIAGEGDAASPVLDMGVSGCEFDHVRALIGGRVQVAGCNAGFHPGKIGDLNPSA